MNYDINGNVIFPQYAIGGSQQLSTYAVDGTKITNVLEQLHSEEITSGQSPQGMAKYGNYIFQFFSTSNKLKVINATTYAVINEMSCTFIGHGNNLQFGKTVQSNGFPLLYASDSNSADARYIYVVSADTTQCSLVDTINIPSAVGNFPNGVIDFDNEKIYTLGYTASTVRDDTGKNAICILDLNNPSTVIDTWQLDYLGVMNGLLFDGKYIIMNANTWDGTTQKFHYINPQTKEIFTTLTFDKEYDSEYQGMDFDENFILVSKWIYKTVSGNRKLFYEFYKLA